jgi:exopolysaccharide production protein ExoY
MALVDSASASCAGATTDSSGGSREPWRGKRLFDAGGAALLIAVAAPLMLLVALAVRLTSRGPVLFRQRRVGRGGPEFPMLKFRTMHVDAEQRLLDDEHLYRRYLDGCYKIPSRLDPRVTRVGRWLRVFSLDELPQLFNVLTGHMSLVGPRPVTRRELAEYGDRVDAYLGLRPGLTGLWQVGGRNHVVFPFRADLDVRYHHDCRAWLDVKIVARTPLAVVLRRGAE